MDELFLEKHLLARDIVGLEGIEEDISSLISREMDKINLLVPSGSAAGNTNWGKIRGTLAEQTDLVDYIATQISPENLWDRTGTTLSPHTVGDSVDLTGGTLLGNSTSGGTLTLSSTSHATKGKVIFGTSVYDEVNNRLGIGTDTPVCKSHIFNGSDNIKIQTIFGANADGVRLTYGCNDASRYASVYTWDENDGGSASYGTLNLGSSTGLQGIVIDGSGNVGINGTPSGALLHISPTDQTTAAYGQKFGTDTNLYRSAADTLRTNDSLVVDINLGVGVVTPTYQVETAKTIKAGTAMYANTRALDFDGGNDYVNLGDITELNSVANFTISTWVKQDVIGVTDELFHNRVDTTHRVDIQTSTTGSSIYVFVGNGANTYGVLNNYQNYMTASRWHRLSVAYDGAGATDADKLKLYIDGTYVAFTSITGPIPATTADLSSVPTYVGYLSNSWDGQIQDFRIYSSSVGASDIATIYQGGTYTTNMVHQYKLMEGSGTVATDTGSNVMNGTISGATWGSTGNTGIQTDFGRGALTLAQNKTTAEWGLWFGNENPMYRCGSNEVAADFRLALSDGVTSPTTSTYGLTFGGATAGTPDTNLYRSAANTLKTDDNFGLGVTATYQLETSKTMKAGTAFYGNTRALDFDGNNDYVNLGNITEQNSVANLTMTAWVKQDVVPSTDYIFWRDVSGGNINDLKIYTNGTNSRLYIELGNGSNTYVYLDNYSNYITAGRWHHVAVVYDGGGVTDFDKIKIYIDSVDVTQANASTNIPATTADMSASNAYISATATAWDGQIKDFRIYSSSVGASDIATIYQGGTYTTNMVHQYKLMEGTGTTATDTGSNTLNGTISGATWSTDSNVAIGTDFGRGALTLAPYQTTAPYGIWFGFENPMYRCGSNEVAADFKLALADGVTSPTTSAYGLTLGGATAGTPDVNLYRSAADMLKTDDSLTIAGDASVFGSFTMTEAKNIALGTTTGTKIGTATGQKLGFWNVTPVVQQVLATGASKTVDEVITFLQTIGLCKQS